jgi:uncharacterized membrane protein
MELNADLFSQGPLWFAALIYAWALIAALRMAPWRRLRDNEQLHVFLGVVVVLLLLWHMRVDVQPGLWFHLLGVTAVTLMFGWSLSIIAASLALIGVTFNLQMGWDGFVLNALLVGVLPATMTQVLLVLIRWYLPKHFFVYVLVNGFLTAGFVGVISGYIAAWLLVSSGAYSFAELNHTVLPFFPLMFLPEAMLNGWVVAVLVAFRPAWVGSFSDELYLKGK